jgi:RNA polymerase sigma factor (sigma-70 family)
MSSLRSTYVRPCDGEGAAAACDRADSRGMSPLVSAGAMRGKPDSYLVALARACNDAAFAAIVERYRSALHRQCCRYLSSQRAEDAVQQTFIRAMQSLRSGSDVRDLGAWLYTIARNVALNEVSKIGWDHEELPDGWEEGDNRDDVAQRTEVRETLGAVAALPHRQRTALLRSVVDGFSLGAIAAELGVTEGAARQLVHRARSTLRAGVAGVLPYPFVWLARRIGALAAKLRSASAIGPLGPKLTTLMLAAVATFAPVATFAALGAAAHRPASLMVAADRARLSSRSATSRSGRFSPMDTHSRYGPTTPGSAPTVAGGGGTVTGSAPTAVGGGPTAARGGPTAAGGGPTAAGGGPTAAGPPRKTKRS